MLHLLFEHGIFKNNLFQTPINFNGLSNVKTTVRLLLVALLLSCNGPVVSDYQQTKIKESLKLIRGDIGETVIHFDDENIIEISPDIVVDSSILSEEQLFFGRISGLAHHNGNYYVVDSMQNAILMFDEHWEFTGLFGGYGRGPQDFAQPLDILHSNGKFFVVEAGNARIQIFDENFESIDSFDAKNLALTTNNITGNDEHVVLSIIDHFGSHSLSVIEPETYRKVTSLIPKIFELGDGPMGINIVETHMNPQGLLVAASSALPHIFVFDSSFQLTDYITLMIEGAIDENGNYIFQSENLRQPNHTIRRSGSVIIDDDATIYWSDGSASIQVLEKSGQEYQYSRTLTFQTDEEYPVRGWNYRFVNGNIAAVNIFIPDRLFWFNFQNQTLQP